MKVQGKDTYESSKKESISFSNRSSFSKNICTFAPIKVKKKYMTRKNVTTIGLAAAKLMGINRTHIIEWE